MRNTLLFTAASLSLFVSVAIPTRTSAVSLYLPFGGKITDKISCLCSLTTKITVEGSPYWDYIKVPFVTDVYDYGHLDTGYTVVGQALPVPIPCIGLVVSITGVSCGQRGQGFIIDKIGTNETK